MLSFSADAQTRAYSGTNTPTFADFGMLARRGHQRGP